MNYYNDLNKLEWSDAAYIESEDDADADAESIASLASSNTERSVEGILAEANHKSKNDDPDCHRFYLVKWTDSPVLRSSWEHASFLVDYQDVLQEWQAEKKRQQEGKSVPFDCEAFNKSIEEQEFRDRARRRLRRFKRHIQRILSIVETD